MIVLKRREIVQFNRLVRAWLRRSKSGRDYAKYLANRMPNDFGLGCALFGLPTHEAERMVNHAVELAGIRKVKREVDLDTGEVITHGVWLTDEPRVENLYKGVW